MSTTTLPGATARSGLLSDHLGAWIVDGTTSGPGTGDDASRIADSSVAGVTNTPAR